MSAARKDAHSSMPLLRQMFVVSGASINILGHGCMHGYPAVLFSQLRSPAHLQNSTSGMNHTAGSENAYNLSLTLNHTPENEIFITDSDASWIAAILAIMALVGNIFAPFLMDRYGRQKTHLLTTIPGILGWISIFMAKNVPTLILARLLHGLAMGIRTPLAAILVAEYSSPKYRGAFLGTFAISLGLGILFTHFIGAYLTWRMTALTSSMFPVLAMLIIGFSPESPSWLAAKGRFDSCSTAFNWLRGDSEEEKRELQILIASQKIQNAEQEKKEWRRLFAVFKKKEFFKPAIIAICMFVVFEFGGAHIIPAYANRILKDILNKTANETVHWQITIVDSLRTVSAFVAIMLLKKYNRRTILFTSGTLTVLSFLSISTYVYLRKHGVYSPTIDSFLPLTLIIFYVLSFCLGLVPLTWVLCGEIFPLAHRSFGSTFSNLCLPVAFMITLKTAPHLFDLVGVEGAYFVYAIILTICLVIIYHLLPETRGRTLEEIELTFRGEKSPSDVEVKVMLK